ncbi:MAG: Crp/Fnr family transcriptional regulator [Clostridiaceae bacterium]|nr:Crp/Fnr family transcriptional regulator [Clostridiaceae bacterium]
MDNTIISTLANNGLFKNMTSKEISDIIERLETSFLEFSKDDIILWEQMPVVSIGIILNGEALAYRTTKTGSNIIMSKLSKGSVFGDILAGAPNKKSPVSIKAVIKTSVLFISYESFVGGDAASCEGYYHMMHNYIETVSLRYFALQDRISCLIMPTLKDKIMSYLRDCQNDKKGEPFVIPFDRESMANYLNADRSAVSRELARLKREGVIDYYKNIFRLLHQ